MSEWKLRANERPKVKYTYTVTGSGSFPFDMLRYDSCWPSDGNSAREMDSSWLVQRPGLRTIHLTSYSPPTVGRWSSFLWRVDDR